MLTFLWSGVPLCIFSNTNIIQWLAWIQFVFCALCTSNTVAELACVCEVRLVSCCSIDDLRGFWLRFAVVNRFLGPNRAWHSSSTCLATCACVCDKWMQAGEKKSLCFIRQRLHLKRPSRVHMLTLCSCERLMKHITAAYKHTDARCTFTLTHSGSSRRLTIRFVSKKKAPTRKFSFSWNTNHPLPLNRTSSPQNPGWL